MMPNKLTNKAKAPITSKLLAIGLTALISSKSFSSFMLILATVPVVIATMPNSKKHTLAVINRQRTELPQNPKFTLLSAIFYLLLLLVYLNNNIHKNIELFYI
jgi:hypothetical protein